MNRLENPSSGPLPSGRPSGPGLAVLAFRAHQERLEGIAERWEEEWRQPSPDLEPLIWERQDMFDQSVDLVIAAHAENPHPDFGFFAANLIEGLQEGRAHCSDPHCPCAGTGKLHLVKSLGIIIWREESLDDDRIEWCKTTPEQTQRLLAAFPQLNQN